MRDSQDLEQEWSACAHVGDRYEVEYPSDWRREGSFCRTFRHGDARLDVMTTLSLQSLLQQLFDPSRARSVERSVTRVNGRFAIRFATETSRTDERTYGYAIRRGKGGIVVSGSDGDRSVVDHAAETLRFLPRVSLDASPDVLPGAVDRKRRAIVNAAEQRDYDALGKLVDPVEFAYTFGQPTAGGPVEYFRAHPGAVDNLARILSLPYTLTAGIYVWPFAYDRQLSELTGYERDLLGSLIPHSLEGDSPYLGWRAGIRPDGRWIFFVAGD